jgi:hypothetical protein
MAVLQLNKEDTFRLLLYARKLSFFLRTGSFTTKTMAPCLACKAPNYISFSQTGVEACFCNSCKHRANKGNMAQIQYIRRIKESQLELIEGTSKHIMRDIAENGAAAIQ